MDACVALAVGGRRCVVVVAVPVGHLRPAASITDERRAKRAGVRRRSGGERGGGSSNNGQREPRVRLLCARTLSESIPSGVGGGVSCLDWLHVPTSSSVPFIAHLLACGFIDGSVRIYQLLSYADDGDGDDNDDKDDKDDGGKDGGAGGVLGGCELVLVATLLQATEKGQPVQCIDATTHLSSSSPSVSSSSFHDSIRVAITAAKGPALVRWQLRFFATSSDKVKGRRSGAAGGVGGTREVRARVIRCDEIVEAHDHNVAQIDSSPHSWGGRSSGDDNGCDNGDGSHGDGDGHGYGIGETRAALVTAGQDGALYGWAFAIPPDDDDTYDDDTNDDEQTDNDAMAAMSDGIGGCRMSASLTATHRVFLGSDCAAAALKNKHAGNDDDDDDDDENDPLLLLPKDTPYRRLVTAAPRPKPLVGVTAAHASTTATASSATSTFIAAHRRSDDLVDDSDDNSNNDDDDDDDDDDDATGGAVEEKESSCLSLSSSLAVSPEQDWSGVLNCQYQMTGVALSPSGAFLACLVLVPGEFHNASHPLLHSLDLCITTPLPP